MVARELVTIQGLEGVMKTLKELPPEVVSKRGGPVRSALMQAAKMMAGSVRENLQRITASAVDDAGTGLLLANISQKRGRLSGGERGELYSVRVKNKTYQNKKGKKVTTAQVARLLEYGTEKRPPMPFIRPAFDENRGKVFPLFVNELNKKLLAIQKRLAKNNGVA